MAIEVKEIKTLVSEYVSGITEGIGMHSQWKSIAGKDLENITDFEKADGSTIIVVAKSPAAYSLLMLKRKKIIKAFSEKFPDSGIATMRIKRAY